MRLILYQQNILNNVENAVEKNLEDIAKEMNMKRKTLSDW